MPLLMALCNLRYDLFDKLGQRGARKPQRFLRMVPDLTINANVHLRQAANSTHLNLTFDSCYLC